MARKEKGVSQGGLANLLDVTQATVHQWEAGKRNPKLETLKKIATALGLSVEYFLDNEFKNGNEALNQSIIEITQSVPTVRDIEKRLLNFTELLPLGLYIDFVDMVCVLSHADIENLIKYGRFIKQKL
jgi:transcriptional regulator with XRE-family HTH domain